jgi:hypothetical protein
MRRLLVLCLGAMLVLPAAAAAIALVPGDGTLHVDNGDGKVRLGSKFAPFSGVVLGRISVGKLEIIDPEEECEDLLVWNEDDTRERPLRARDGIACVFVTFARDEAMRFRLVREDGEITMSGKGLWVSAVGQGVAYLQGTTRRAGDGTYSINGQRPRSLPERGEWVPVGNWTTRPSLP